MQCQCGKSRFITYFLLLNEIVSFVYSVEIVMLLVVPNHSYCSTEKGFNRQSSFFCEFEKNPKFVSESSKLAISLAALKKKDVESTQNFEVGEQGLLTISYFL